MAMVTQTLMNEKFNTGSKHYKLSDTSIDLLVDIMLTIAMKEDCDANHGHGNAAA